MLPKYAPALCSAPPYAASVHAVLRECTTLHEQLTAQVTAPVLFTYVWHVLREAQQLGLQRLYFLARDGYVLLAIAQEIAKIHPVQPELRYLYCSRSSLRMPSYHRIDPDEAMELLLHRGTNLTRRYILDRARLTDAQRHAVYEALGNAEFDEYAPLDEHAFADFCAELRNCDVFREAVQKNSRDSYDTAVAYFRQEGLMDGVPFGIVDSGWTGSMQRSLRQLSDEIPPLTGFYFGMFAKPKSAEDGDYRTWYFSADSSIGVLTKFNNNLFECMCAAPHGMTIGYRKEKENRYAPVCEPVDAASLPAVEAQIAVCSRFAAACAAKIRYDAFDSEQMHRISRQLLQGLMYRPDREEALAFQAFHFCDDVTEAYSDTLVRENSEQILREHQFLHRVFRRLRGKKPSRELFWIYGTLAVSALPCKAPRRLSLRAWDILRCMINKRRPLA